MSKHLVNLTTNPCKMCMPMGVITAFYGISKCMSILHGSQGCSTYIRRHMATHYNEPVDIASSSLTEHGTVYGGEKNLIKGIENLITLYNPEVIGVATTCLAETIGEDISHIIKNFYEQHPESKVKLIPVPSGGYMGTQYEGFFRGLYGIVSHIEMDKAPNDKINIITGPLSPADTRYLKSVLEQMAIDYILLPDLSQNLDGGHYETYNRLPEGGTTLEAISKMAGAKATLELSTFIEEKYSPGKYLAENYGVAYKKLNLPVGLRDTDAFIKALSEVSGTPIPDSIKEERARYLDAMIDSHKYNAEGRAVVFGEPDFVYGITKLCSENGIMPVVTAVGTKCKMLKAVLKEEIEDVADRLFVKEYITLDEADFETIESYALKFKANIMIGSSDGRRIEEKHGISLVRCAFPVHDRIGGQRIRMLGYEGGLSLLDTITNTVLKSKEGGFRKELYNKYYKPNIGEASPKASPKAKASKIRGLSPRTKVSKIGGLSPKTKTSEIGETSPELTLEDKKKTHPCFSCSSAHKYARIHLPIAPKCNISCNYCVRKFDCPNESRPGVTTQVLEPQEALERYIQVKKDVPNLTVVGIAGPGDALANFDKTKETLSLIKQYDKNVTFCLSTNGLMLPMYASELLELGVSHVTVTINAIDPKIGAQIYKRIRYLGTTYTGVEAATILMANQLSGLKYLASRGLVCKVNIVTLKGINDHHIEEVVKKVKELGATITNIMQMIPVEGSVFENIPLVSNKEITALREKCGIHLEQMLHCKQCRADAIGMLDKDISMHYSEPENKEAFKKLETTMKPIRFAIASKSGMLIDEHFGHAKTFYIYDYKEGKPVYIENRNVNKYCEGSDACDEEQDKIEKILNTIQDCQGVLTLRIGHAPEKKLMDRGIKVFKTYDRIEKAVQEAAQQLL
ncbi:nitrogenase cofactor biosynthesis protein NifB [Cellulosilyticum sp. I15G10I2]|uniref:nitrogenase cofactor biosynthesis protein NifB n=1 Tax=Cellulosilyticum sp. I15G10I2 TaxID=1892843 RepID=UPI00085CBF07|nr:nitrogenase cofactor biosynthesis protein NifB [Cellulosilyticum sp. I15G10I2]